MNVELNILEVFEIKTLLQKELDFYLNLRMDFENNNLSSTPYTESKIKELSQILNKLK
jgi:hypothetical protein